MTTRENFLKVFTELLEEYGLSVLSFSHKVSIDARLIRKWKENKTPSLQSLIKIANYFNCSLDYLIGRTLNFDYQPSLKQAEFYSRYSLLRESLHLNDNKIASLCKIGNGTISKWKSGRIPDLEILAQLCKVLDCSLDYLVGRSD